MAQTRAAIVSRIASLCAGEPYAFVQAQSPFDFDQMPSGKIDAAFRITVEQQESIGGTSFTEDRTDTVTVWLARKLNSAPTDAYQQLLADVETLQAGIIRDGATGGGDYHVPDGGECQIEHEDGREFAVARLALPVNYEVQY